MKMQELKMLRQFAETVFELTHGWDFDKEPQKMLEILMVIGNLSFTAKDVSRLFQGKEAHHD